MDCNACSTKLLLMWMRTACNKTTNEDKVAFFLARMRFILSRFGIHFRAPAQGFQVDIGDWNMIVSPTLLVSNLKLQLRSLHLEIENAWRIQWDSMAEELQVPWSTDGLPLQSVIRFAMTVERFRRKQCKSAWKNKNVAFLQKLQSGLAAFLARVVEMMVNHDRSPFLNKTLPPRRFYRSLAVINKGFR